MTEWLLYQSRKLGPERACRFESCLLRRRIMFKFFKKDNKEPENFKEILAYFKNLEKNFEKLSEELENLKKESQFSIQKIGLVRFNPFKEIGGDQSFSVALLDSNDSGIVITSLYTRESNRVYGKPIEAGSSKYLLSEEENQALEIAKKNAENNQKKLNHPTTGGGGAGAH